MNQRLFHAPITRTPLTEKTLQALVIELARILGWRCAHFRPAKTGHGWRTPVQGDGEGFPDCILVHPKHGVLWRELKSSTGRLGLEQEGWQAWLEAAGENFGVWSPADWYDGVILAQLKGDA